MRETSYSIAQFAAGQAYTSAICVTCGQCRRVGRRYRQAKQVVRVVQLDLREEACMLALVADADRLGAAGPREPLRPLHEALPERPVLPYREIV